MRRADVIRTLQDNADALRKEGVSHLYLFGSVARDEANDNSDVDVLIDPIEEETFGLFALGGVYMTLKDILGCKVDVLVRSDVLAESRIGKRIVADVVNVF